VSILGILFSEARAMIMLPWPHGKESTHEVLRFSLQTGNFPLRTLIGIIMTLLAEERWGI
jgi:hypothetical protein